MATGYIVSGRGDLDTLFKARASTAAGDTGFKSNGGVDLAQRFEPRGSTTAIAATGFVKAIGTDLAQIFMDIAASSETVTIDPVTWTANASSGATSGYQLLTNGDIRRITNGAASDAGDWLVPKTGAPGAYEARVTMISGALTGGTVGSWLPISGAPQWVVTRPSGNGTSSAVFTLEIRNGAGVVQDTATITLNATIP